MRGFWIIGVCLVLCLGLVTVGCNAPPGQGQSASTQTDASSAPSLAPEIKALRDALVSMQTSIDASIKTNNVTQQKQDALDAKINTLNGDFNQMKTGLGGAIAKEVGQQLNNKKLRPLPGTAKGPARRAGDVGEPGVSSDRDHSGIGSVPNRPADSRTDLAENPDVPPGDPAAPVGVWGHLKAAAGCVMDVLGITLTFVVFGLGCILMEKYFLVYERWIGPGIAWCFTKVGEWLHALAMWLAKRFGPKAPPPAGTAGTQARDELR